jgi:hypothetical protein
MIPNTQAQQPILNPLALLQRLMLQGRRLRHCLGGLLGLVLIGIPCATAQTIGTDPWTKLVPSAGLPPELNIQDGNNNLDVAAFGGRYYFAFRTGPSHFASPKVHIYVLSSADRQHWQLEKDISMGADLREPRFLAMDTALYFYCFEAGTKALAFQPEHVWGCHLGRSGTFSELRNLHWDGFVPWRMRRLGERMFMSVYYGRDLYNDKHKGEVRLLTSTDGYDWKAISPHPQTGDKGGEEAEFIFDAQGNLWGTIRLEGAGAQVIYAHRDSLDHWHCYPTRDKYDSALLFRHGKQIFLVSRRNLDGPAERGQLLPPKLRRNYNLARYSLTRKCTALWLLEPHSKSLVHIMDFPSTGDTAFPGILDLGNGSYWLLNYSSAIDGPPKNWIRGQLGKTYIYQTVLHIVGN